MARAARAEAADLLQEWRDPARGRTIPVRIRLPDTMPTPGAPAPVAILSHGLGGSRDGLAYLGIALAQAGFVVVHLQHHGSDSGVLRSGAGPAVAMALSVLDVRNALDRLYDVAFALDELARQPAWRGRLDLARAAIAGHSFGAWTVTHMLGEALPGVALLGEGRPLALPDRRLAAGIALSPVPPLLLPARSAFARVSAPILHVTGTRDSGVVDAATPEDRTIPFHTIAAPGVLAVLAGATHASFAGEPAAGARWNEPTYHERTARLAVLFLRAVLWHDMAAASLLQRGAMLAPGDRIETKGRLAGA
nr:acetylhydrolase [Limobrevibacterium gyesilva]